MGAVSGALSEGRVKELRYKAAAHLEPNRVLPEQELIVHIIKRAIYDVHYYVQLKKRLQGRDHERMLQNGKMALAWIMSPTFKPMSFEWYCHMAGINAQAVRKLAIAMNFELPLASGRFKLKDAS